MKILAVRGRNLASLEEEFELDFTAEPLLSAGIFAITGSTGSGKSTLLDALCLALFDDTPRMNRVGEGNIAVPDVGDKTINQKDSRNILRRGAGEGYAEVDFLSLGGEKYRATWSVRRARSRADGSLQSAEMRLVNLSSGEEVQGGKTELLSRIVGLTEMTFAQFTRAVLLAQGDFAVFLKARQSEKAEILEKITGTEVYSRISIAIYEKTKQSEQEYLALKERMQGIALLPDEQMEAYGVEQSGLEEEARLLKEETERLKIQLKWIDDREAICRNIERANQSLSGIRRAMEEAEPRYDYVAQIESVQEIRDSFYECRTAQKQIEQARADLQRKTAESESNAKALSLVEREHSLLVQKQEALDVEIARMEPEIRKAGDLDIRMEGARANAEEADREYRTAQSSKERIEKNVLAVTEEIERDKASVNELAAWFEEYGMYGEIVPQTDLIVTLLNEMQAAREQSRINLKRRQENEEILEGETERLSELKKETERLNRLLPAEIVLLRSKLQEGVPCPVCGSLHHPAQSETGGQSLQEEELSKAKRKILSETERLTAGMEKRKAEITRLGALSEHYADQSAGTAKKVEKYLSALPLWKKEFENGSLINNLKDIAGQWKTNSAKIIALEQSVNNKQALLQGERNNLAETIRQLETKERKRQETAGVLKELQKERMALLGGKNANEVSDYFATRREELVEELKKSAESKSILASGQEMLKGILSRITSEIAQANERYLALQKEIDRWLDREGTLTPEQLAELLGKDKQWVQAEKQFLQDLKEQETACKATLDEREKTLLHHNKAGIKPQNEEETKEYLAERLTVGSLRLEQVRKRLTEIEVAFDNHHKGKERIKALEKEAAEKEVTVENWRKLNELFGSASGAKFKEIAQGYTLDALLAYANKHLKELSGRYELQRIPNTLALQVADLDMLGEVRTVHSLSGGESFLISLALALGLSSLSSHRMKIESLFIDEGFGSLDADALRVAIEALERLQTQGRKIGIISHVAEMTERITAQVCVVKTGSGRSGIRVTGNG